MRQALPRALLVLGLMASLGCGQGQPSFATLSQLQEWIEARKGFGTPEFELLELDEAQYYFARFIPTSGLDHCHLYTFRKSQGPWRLVRHATFPGGCDIAMRRDVASGDILYVASGGAELDRLRAP